MVNLFMWKCSAETVWVTYVVSGELKKDIKWFVVDFSWVFFFVCKESYLVQNEVIPIIGHMIQSFLYYVTE